LVAGARNVTRLPAAPFDEALQWLLLCGSWWGGVMPVRLGSWGEGETCWRGWHRSRDLAGLIRYLDERNDDDVLLGMPQNRPWAGGVSRASMLWCRVEGKDQLERARRFRPLPSIVFAEGSSSRRLLFWPLEQVHPWGEVLAANRRIAYRLRAVQRHGDPDELVFCAPGTCMRVGRSRPVPVRVARLSVATFTLAGVAGRLKDPPDVKWWERAG
jgi:hypothetical protein